MGSTNGSSSQMLMSEMNVTPLVDVMLVLLIIFMITAPLLQQGLEVEVPQTESGGLEVPQEPLRLVIDKDKNIRIGKTKLSRQNLKSFLVEVLKQKKEKQVFIEADQALSYGFIAQIMAEVKNAGATSLGLVTLPNHE
ncbi:MAG: biopolymer transporter ExbD [Bdellovibrionaceae bacterium]|nr:biopolymer transporter ExbD [Pseudobdellovibrionaceae bacterium]